MNPKQYKIFKSDAAPFFFYIDVVPLDLSQYDIPHHVELLKSIQSNPIMPLPLRVDRVYNGESSIFIRPRDIISFPVGQSHFYINPSSLVAQGIEKLIYLTEVRSSREFAYSLTKANAKKWWNSTRYLYTRLRTLEEDFSAFLKAYIYTMVQAKIESEDLVSAARQYCEIIRDICYKRINEKKIIVEIRGKEKIKELYKMKKGKVFESRFKRVKSDLLYPSYIDIEVFNLEESNFSKAQSEELNIKSKIMKYIPLLFYDDLLECMLQNLNTLEEGGDILDPSFLLENNVITQNKDINLEQYSWLNNFATIKINSIMNRFTPTFPYDLR